MKKIALAAICALLILSAGPAAAFVRYTQNEFMTAESLDPGMTQTGIHFSVGERYTSFYPEIRYGLGALAEFGVRVGVFSGRFEFYQDKVGPTFLDALTGTTSEDKIGPLIGVDIKYQLIKETEGIPLDMAVAVGLDNTIIDWKNATEVRFSAILSKNIPLTERGYKLVPYGGVEMAALGGSAVNEKKTSAYAFGGLEWKMSQKAMLLLEIKGGSATVGGLGIRFEY